MSIGNYSASIICKSTLHLKEIIQPFVGCFHQTLGKEKGPGSQPRKGRREWNCCWDVFTQHDAWVFSYTLLYIRSASIASFKKIFFQNHNFWSDINMIQLYWTNESRILRVHGNTFEWRKKIRFGRRWIPTFFQPRMWWKSEPLTFGSNWMLYLRKWHQRNSS